MRLISTDHLEKTATIELADGTVFLAQGVTEEEFVSFDKELPKAE